MVSDRPAAWDTGSDAVPPDTPQCPAAAPGLPAPLMQAWAGAAAGMALFDDNDVLRMANPWFQQAMNIDRGAETTWESMMRRCHATRRGLMISSDDIEGWLAQIGQRRRRTPVRSFESDLTDGRWVWVTETVLPDAWLLVVMVDVSPMKAMQNALLSARDEAVRISMKDPLTDLYNRRYIMQHLHDSLQQSRAMRAPLVVVVLDLDHFKHINDRSGHDIGDAVLCHFAAQLREQLRPADAVGRIGGEEFLMILSNTTLDGASAMLARARELISDSIAAAGQPIPDYTFSAGMAQANERDDAASIFRRADYALYCAKRSGRDRDWTADSRSMRL